MMVRKTRKDDRYGSYMGHDRSVVSPWWYAHEIMSKEPTSLALLECTPDNVQGVDTLSCTCLRKPTVGGLACHKAAVSCKTLSSIS